MDFAQTTALEALLDDFVRRTPDDVAAEHAQKTRQLIEQTSTPWRSQPVTTSAARTDSPPHPSGHVTASAWVLNASRSHAALLHHRKLGLWLQPGGHVEETDRSWLDASHREVLEETGLAALGLSNEYGAALFDVDTHRIPARASAEFRAAEPEHTHFDLRFLWIAQGEQTLTLNVHESLGLRWFELSALAADQSLDASVRRTAVRSLHFGVGG